MKILFITDNFPPEVVAPALRTFDHCNEWTKFGAEVEVITCFPNFPQGKVYNGYKNRFKKIEIIGNIKVTRIWTFIRPNSGILLRTIDQLSFALNATLHLLFIKRKSYDLIVTTSPQFFVGITASLISKIKNIPWFFEVRDLWPEGIIFLKNKSFIYKLLEKLEGFYYNDACGVITVTKSYKDDIIERFNVSEDKFCVAFNSAKNKNSLEIKKDFNLKKQLNLENKFIVGYAGTIGISQGLDFILRCIKKNAIHSTANPFFIHRFRRVSKFIY